MFLLLITALLGSPEASANYSRSVCQKLVAETNTQLKIAQDRYQVGEVDYTQVARAELDLLEVQFQCRAILFNDYCEKALPVARRRLDGVMENEKVGLGSIAETHAARKELAVLEGLCH